MVATVMDLHRRKPLQLYDYAVVEAADGKVRERWGEQVLRGRAASGPPAGAVEEASAITG